MNYEDITRKLVYGNGGTGSDDEDIYSDEDGDDEWESEGEMDEQ